MRIYDHASVPPASLSRAKATATHVFGAIGIEPQWLDCWPHEEETPACVERPGAANVFAMIVPRPGAAHARASAMFGLAVLREGGGGSHIYVFHDRVQALAVEHPELSAATILGHVLAHEIGHLLMGSESHTTSGIMSARWFGKELRRMAKGDLLFDPAQRLRLRAGFLARTSEGGATAPSP